MREKVREAVNNVVFHHEKCLEIVYAFITLVTDNNLSAVERQFCFATASTILDRIEHALRDKEKN